MEKQKVSLGRVVLYGCSNKDGETVERPATIVRVWNDDMVNLRVWLDGTNDWNLTGLPDGAIMLGSFWATSASRATDEAVPEKHKFRFPPRS